MTALVVVGLVLLAACDGALAGFRSSVGRNGMVDHRRQDLVAQGRGLVLAVLLLVPAALVALVVADRSDVVTAGRWMLAVYAPYGLLVVLALAIYLSLGWRTRFLAMALVLGPFTLARPLVAVAGGVLGALVAQTLAARVAVVLSVVAVLAVQPLCDRLWHARLRSPVGGAGPSPDDPPAR